MEELQTANPLIGPLFYLSFTVVIYFVLANVFLAVINEAYGKANEHINTEDQRFWCVQVQETREEKKKDREGGERERKGGRRRPCL